MTQRFWAFIAVAGIVLTGALSCTVLPPVESTPPYASSATPTSLPTGPAVCARLVPPGATVEVEGMAMMVNAVVRPADGVVATGSVLNPAPQAGDEFIMVALSITCEQGTGCVLSPADEFALVGSRSGSRAPQTGLIGVPGLLGEQQLPRGATVYGAMVFGVGQGERGLTLVYEGASAVACLMVPDWAGGTGAGWVRPGVLPTATPLAGPTATPWPTPPTSPLATPLPPPTATPLPTPVLLPESGRSP